MKKILIVNNNMHIGGIQKALVSLLHEIKDQYDITLYLFSSNGVCFADLPETIKVITGKGPYRCFGVSQAEAKQKWHLYFGRTVLAGLTRLFGRPTAIALANLGQPVLQETYDVAISYLHSGHHKSFYGGCNEFVIHKVKADKKITFLHGDYSKCGANHPKTNRLYRKFDVVAACSEGCRQSFISVLPDRAEHCAVVPNCHNFAQMRKDGLQDTVAYEDGFVHILTVARLTGEKCVERGIQAVAYAVSKGKKVCYHIVGDGVERKKLERLVEELSVKDCVFFHGNQENPYRFMKKADLLLITSAHEAAPLVIDEAMCFHLPVLSTKTSSAEEMILRRGLGWVCDNSQEALTEAIVNILDRPERLMEQKAIMLHTECNNKAAVAAFVDLVR